MLEEVVARGAVEAALRVGQHAFVEGEGDGDGDGDVGAVVCDSAVFEDVADSGLLAERGCGSHRTRELGERGRAGTGEEKQQLGDGE